MGANTAYSQEVFNSYITVNGQSFEEPVWVDYYGPNSKENRVQLEPIMEELEIILSKSLMTKIRDAKNSEGKVFFESLKASGISTRLDINTLDLTLTVDKKDKKTTAFYVSGRKRADDDPNLLKPSFFSGYVNVRGAGELVGATKTILGNQYDKSNSMSLEGVLNFGGLVLESQYLYSDNVDVAESRWSRLHTRAVFDDQKRSVRYTLGDLNHDVRGFQEIVLGAGLGINKEFAIRPNYFRSSFTEYRFYLDTDSIVEIFVNGALVKRKTLPQGPVELSDFPFNAGENEVKVRVTDSLGAVKNINFSDINDIRLLSKGMSDFGFNLMYERIEDSLDLNLKDSYDTDDQIFSGFYHIGAAEDLVTGFNLQYRKKRALLGLETVYGTSRGILSVDLAGSVDKETNKNGFASRVEHETLFFRKGALANFRLFTSGEYKSESFSNFLRGPTKSKYRLRASVGQNFKNSIRASLGAAKEWFYAGNQNTYLTSNFGWTLYKNFDFSSNIRVNLDDSEDTTVLLSLNWRSPANNQQLTSTYDPQENSATAEFVTFPLNGRQNFRTSVGAEHNESAKRASAGLDYFNQRFEIRASHSSAFIDNGNSDHSTNLSFGFGLAFAGNSFAVSRPVENSFALIGMKGRPSGYSVPINRGANSQRGEINMFGPAAITNLAPYFSDRAILDISTLPYGYSLKDESFRFKPSYKSGVKIKVKVDGEVSVSGKAVFADGQPAAYVTGAVYTLVAGKKGELIQQVFTGNDGSFGIEKIEASKYILSFETAEDIFKDVEISVGSTVGVYELKEDVVLKK